MKIRKIALLVLLSGIFMYLLLPLPVLAAEVITPATAKVFVNGASKSFDAYNIDGYNYFKLRDIAFVLTGTAKQFEVAWDESANTVSLQSGKAYTAVGGELSAGEEAVPAPSASKLVVNGIPLSFTVYHANGNNYFKLRDLAKTLNFGVEWDEPANAVSIRTDAGYVVQNTTPLMKSFGTYIVSNDWPESPELSRNDQYFYVKAGTGVSGDGSRISVESGRNKYSKDDSSAFRDAIHRQLLREVASDPNAASLFGGETAFTEKGYPLCIFTVEYAKLNITSRQYYILGDNKYILVQETDHHDKNAPDIDEATYTILNSFEWPK
ncbi:MAG: copper amine oxidase N-terminal domain-containing protein [Clostridiales Family XIII bacterium]|nr:copper amine oxidase N-terminal domain-containing protein [Clostridiales Family XIII bacterium]